MSLVLALIFANGSLTLAGATRPAARPVPGEKLFATTSSVVRLQIEIARESVDQLRRQPRADVPAVIREGKTAYTNMLLHLKGAVGSFRPIDDKPSLTLKFDRGNEHERFHGLRQLHLNNAVEDPSLLREKIGAMVFNVAGVPAPRVVHALVELNDRRLGLYVLKEGFTPEFLGLYFSNPNGDLYEGSGLDVTNHLDRDWGSGPDDQISVKTMAAALEAPADQRWASMTNVLEMERFLTFMALEVMLGHRDGYCLARNNYRLYHDPETRRLVFLPHGMDVLFGNADLPWRPHTAGLVATTVLAMPEGATQYRERFGILLTNVLRPVELVRQADQWAEVLRMEMNRSERKTFDAALVTLKDRIVRRHRSLIQQFNSPEPRLLEFRNQVAPLIEWQPVPGSNPTTTIRSHAPDQRAALCVTSKPAGLSAWQCRVLLSRGRYRIEGSVRVRGVKPLDFGKNQGAGLRVQNKARAVPYHLVGESEWKTESVEFEVSEAQEMIDLLCEIRAREGQAWFATDSLRLVRIP